MNSQLFDNVGCVSTLKKFKNGTTVIVVPYSKNASIETIGKIGIAVQNMANNSLNLIYDGEIGSIYIDPIDLREMNFDSPELLAIYQLRKAYDELNKKYNALFKEMEGRSE